SAADPDSEQPGSQRWQRTMEPLWSPVVATGGNQRQIGSAQKRREQAKTVAGGCDRSPKAAHGKEGVDGSSPSEGSAKAPEIGAFSFRQTCSVSNVRCVWSRLWSFRVENAAVVGRNGALASL